MIATLENGTLGTRLAGPTLLLLPLAVIGHRFGLWGFTASTAMLALCLLASVTILLCSAIIYFRSHNPARRRNLRNAMLLAAVMPALVVGFLASMSMRGPQPVIHDVTTDTEQVPRFDRAAAMRGDESNTLAIKPDSIAAQKEAYPQLQPLPSPLDPEQAFSLALAVASNLGWTVYNADPTNGRIEAYEKTALWGFIDDVVIRITPTDDGTIIDLRSVSRVGRGDLGANAQRIERFIEAFHAGQA